MGGAGSAYIFKLAPGGYWKEIQKIVSSDRGAGDNFGHSVSIDGIYAVVGAYLEKHDSFGGNQLQDAGAAYIFRDIVADWIQVKKLVSSDRTVFAVFGWSVTISGSYVMVGAKWETTGASGIDTLPAAGSVYIFEKDSVQHWNQVQKISNSDREDTDEFGWSVSISGGYAIVGAHEEDEDTSGGNTLSRAGSAYIFKRTTGGTWSEEQKIVASDRAAADKFGNSVSISGNFAIVGAWQEDEDTSGGNTITDAGAAYLFETCQSTSSTIDQTACNSFTSPSGDSTWSSSGTYFDIIPNSAGCDSIITINLTVNIVDTSVTKEGDTLTANLSNASYQWLDCGNGNNPITFETNRSFIAVTNGSYAVIVTENGCTDTSSCYNLMDVGISDFAIDQQYHIYPNPSNSSFTVEWNRIENNDMYIEILNTVGQVIERSRLISTGSNYMYFSGLDKGIYILRISSKELTIQKLVVVQ